MNVSLYQAAAAMNANARWQELISQNLASASVPGYRKQDVSFSSIAAGLNPATGAQTSIPAAVAATNFTQGPMRATGNKMDFGLQGPGFFEVQLPNGDKAYTRDGEFSLNAQGQLVTKQGYAVASDSGTLQFDPSNPAPISVTATGEVTQGSDPKGQIKVAEFAQLSQLSAIGQGYFQAGANVQPSDPTSTTIAQGYLEAANTSPVEQMSSLITALRMFEADEKVFSMQDEHLGKVISELGSPN